MESTLLVRWHAFPPISPKYFSSISEYLAEIMWNAFHAFHSIQPD
jgi:hypothetical protein